MASHSYSAGTGSWDMAALLKAICSPLENEFFCFRQVKFCGEGRRAS